jgi:hypothetical protein
MFYFAAVKLDARRVFPVGNQLDRLALRGKRKGELTLNPWVANSKSTELLMRVEKNYLLANINPTPLASTFAFGWIASEFWGLFHR